MRLPIALLVALALGSLILALIKLGDPAVPDHQPEPPPAAVQPIVKLPPATSSSTATTAAPTTTTTAAARTAPTVHAAAASRPAPAGDIPDLIRSTFTRFGPAVAEQAIRVASCESTGDPDGTTFDPSATGDEGEVGLFQIHPRYHAARAAKFGWTMNDLYDPAKNVVVAADLYAEKGTWGPTWSCAYAA